MKRFHLQKPSDWSPFMVELMVYRDAEKPLTITVEPYKKKRSLSANSYYWSCIVTPLAEFCGYNEGQMHEEILGSYFGWEVRDFRGHQREVPRRTTTTPDLMETVDFQGLISHGQQIAAELGVRLPDQENATEETR